MMMRVKSKIKVQTRTTSSDRKPEGSQFETAVALIQTRRAAASVSNSPTPRRDIFWWNSAITGCFRSGEVERARRYFEEMPHKNVVTWNCMISGYTQNRRIVEAHKVFDLMPRKNVVSWTALLTGYAKCGRMEEARDLFDRIPETERNVVCWNSMMSGYVNNGDVGKARELFDEMPVRRNTVSWSIMILGYLQDKRVAEARFLFDRASSCATSLCNALLSGYVELGYLGDAEELFAKMTQRDVISWNAMITCYSRAGKMDRARRLFEEMPEKDVISWTAVIHGYVRNGNIEAACKLFHEMPGRDVVAWNTMMSGFVQNGMLEDALRLFAEMPTKDIVSWNTILQGYVQRDDMVGARRWFEEMPQRSETSWNTLISGYRSEEALVLFSEMVRVGFRPDQGTLTVVVSICATLVALGCGRMVHLYAIRSGYESDTLIMSSFIAMYSRCGLISDATRAFECTLKRDTITWNAMIATYAYHGFATEALKLFERMRQDGFSPDHATFLSLLFACAHKGLVHEGCRYFMSMQKDWELAPKPEHYSCVVDLLGRSGFISQAYDFTDKIPARLQSNSWETLLCACRVHGNLEVGEITAKRVLDDQPSDGGMYILLSNIYAAKGMWKDAASTRALMKARGIRKETGCSWIEVNGKMYSFVSNDLSMMEDVYKELDNLSVVMEAGD